MKRKPTSLPASSPLRHRAEVRLRERPAAPRSRAVAAGSPAGTQRLLHELQVHQIELEMQNEDLRVARDEMAAGLEKYSELYDFAPVGYLTLDRDGTIQEANLTAARLLGLPRAPLVKRRLALFVNPADRALFSTFLSRMFKSESREECEVQLLAHGKPPVEVRIRGELAESGGTCRLAVSDITRHKQAEGKVRVSEIRYRRLFEAAHDGVLLLDPVSRKITDANPFMTVLLGYPRDQLVGKELFEIGLLKDEVASQQMFQRLTRKHEVRYEDLPLESKSGRHQEVEVVANLYQENGHAVIQCNIRDITARKAAEAALRLSEERYRSLFNSIDEGFCVLELLFDRKGKPHDYRFLEMNPSFEAQGGVRGALGKRMREISPDTEAYWLEAYGQVALTGKPVRFSAEAKGRWFDVYAFRLGGKESRKVAVLFLFSNITERKQAEKTLSEARTQLSRYTGRLELLVGERTKDLTATNRRLEDSVDAIKQGNEKYRTLLLESELMQEKLRQLTRQVLTAQEDERRKISRELHDGVVQTLVGINVQLSALSAAASVGVLPLKAKIAHTQRLVEESVKVVHRFARELRPAVLDDLGLIPALHAHLKSVAERENLKINLSAFAGVEALDNAKRTVLYRVVQEALTNVVRHARAGLVNVSIAKISGAARLEVHDDGKSFNVEKVLSPKTNKRLGLLGMRERIEMVGGILTLESAPGEGTTVRADIPFSVGGVA